jgi:hypothetical protein
MCTLLPSNYLISKRHTEYEQANMLATHHDLLFCHQTLIYSKAVTEASMVWAVAESY